MENIVVCVSGCDGKEKVCLEESLLAVTHCTTCLSVPPPPLDANVHWRTLKRLPFCDTTITLCI